MESAVRLRQFDWLVKHRLFLSHRLAAVGRALAAHWIVGTPPSGI
jgi:hypothetical protein